MKINLKNFTDEYLLTLKNLNTGQIDKFAKGIFNIKKRKGRIFFLGVGGSAANCAHAVNDFRKLCEIESYSATDNFSELTARINDEGWDSSFSNWLKISNLKSNDGIFILSVGGGSLKKKVSVNIIKAIEYAKKKKATIFGVVSKDGGYTKKHADFVVHISVSNNKLVTPISESIQSFIWHYFVSHPKLQKNKPKW